MKSLLISLRELSLTSKSNVEMGIIRYILENPEDVSNSSIQALAKKSFSSPTSILRLCKSIGYDGYAEFKKNLIRELATIGKNITHKENEILAKDSITNVINKTTNNNIQSLKDTLQLIDEKNIELLVNKFHTAKIIYLFGLGASLQICNDLYLKMIRLGKTCVFTHDYHTQIVNSYSASHNDMCIFISHSGETEELLKISKLAKEKGALTVAITKYGKTSLSDICDLTIYSSSNESGFSCGTLSSRISQLNIIDIIFNVYCSKYYEESLKTLVNTHMSRKTNERF